jgi:hypothetical protein
LTLSGHTTLLAILHAVPERRNWTEIKAGIDILYSSVFALGERGSDCQAISVPLRWVKTCLRQASELSIGSALPAMSRILRDRHVK